MKNLSIYKFILFLFGAVLLLGVNSCNNLILEDEITEDVGLKSAKESKISYVVVLADAELNIGLSKLKGYEKKELAVKSAATKILKRAGITDGEVEHVYSTALQGFSVKIPPGQFKKLQNDPSVKMIKEDILVTLSPPRMNKKPVRPPKPDPNPTGEVIPWGIDRVGGGIDVTGNSKTVWIIDTGIDLDNPDLNVDIARSKTFVHSKSADDDNGHGTHVAGTIAAIKDNNIGVVGVAAGATVVAVKVLDRRGSGSTSGVIAGVDYVAANGVSGDVANMSLGGSAYQPLDDAVWAASKNIKFSLAAGNESDDANNHSPARVNGSNIYTVSAMDSDDNWAYFSNFGNPPVDYCAPGYSIESLKKGGGTIVYSGTSMAAPHVAGLLVLGAVNKDGYVNGDPDGNPDPIAHH